MIWKTVFIAVFAVGVIAEDNVAASQYMQKFKDYLKEVCKKNGAEDKVAEVEAKFTDLSNCVKSLIDPNTVKNEIEEAKPRGALDEVFKKYCDKSPQLKACISTMTAGVKPCLGSAVSAHVGEANSVTDQLIDFVCHKDGDRIALFIAESGPECFQEKSTAIQECARKTRQSVSSFENLGLQGICSKYDELNTCVVEALEACSNPTPSNMAESLLRYIRNATPCKNF